MYGGRKIRNGWKYAWIYGERGGEKGKYEDKNGEKDDRVEKLERSEGSVCKEMLGGSEKEGGGRWVEVGETKKQIL